MEYLAGWPAEVVVTASVVPDQTVRPNQKVSKTTSLSMSNTSDEYSSVDEDHIFSLTQDVKSFCDVLGKLKLLFTNADGEFEIITSKIYGFNISHVEYIIS